MLGEGAYTHAVVVMCVCVGGGGFTHAVVVQSVCVGVGGYIHAEGEAKPLIASSLTPSSHWSYQSGQSEFLQFCVGLGVALLLAVEPVMILFVAHLSLRLAHSTVRSYLSAVRHM